jgi:hypothetical protein
MRDVVAAILWLAVNIFLFGASWRLSRWLFPGESLWGRWQQIVVLSWAKIVGLALVLGACGWLSGTTLLSGGVLLSCGVLWFTHHFPRNLPARNASEGKRTLGQRLWLGVWGILLAFLLAWIVHEGIIRFPTDWDTLTYHLPLIVQWLHRGSLYAPAEANWANPGNNELLGLWCVALFSGDFLISLNNLPAIMLLASSAVALAEQLAIRPGLCQWCSLAILANYAIPDQAVNANNDVAAAALFLTALCYHLRYLRDGSGAHLILTAISLGLLAGVKYYALGYAALVGGSLLILVWVVHGRGAIGRVVLAVFLGPALWGGYWYLRNLLLTGTPLYPKGLTESTDLMGRIRPDAWWQTSILGNGQPEAYRLLLDAVWRLCGPVHCLAIVAGPLLQLWLLVSVFWQSRQLEGGSAVWGRLALAIWLPAAGLVWGLTPFAATASPGTLDMLVAGFSPIRYGLSFLSLALLALGLLLDDITTGIHALLKRLLLPESVQTGGALSQSLRWRKGVVLLGSFLPAGIFAGGIIYQWARGLLVSYPLRHHLLSNIALLGCDLALAGGVLLGIGSLWPRWRWPLALTVALGLAGSCFPLQRHWHEGFARFYDRHFQETLLEQRIATWEPPLRRLCVLDYRYYPFFGSYRQFFAARPLWLPTYSSLLHYLADYQITVIVAAVAPQGFDRYSRTIAWVLEHPGVFVLDQKGYYWQVYWVHQEELRRELAALPP